MYATVILLIFTCWNRNDYGLHPACNIRERASRGLGWRVEAVHMKNIDPKIDENSIVVKQMTNIIQNKIFTHTLQKKSDIDKTP